MAIEHSHGFYGEDEFNLYCDSCRVSLDMFATCKFGGIVPMHTPTRNFKDPGGASEAGRKLGFETRKASARDPLKWYCPNCVPNKI